MHENFFILLLTFTCLYLQNLSNFLTLLLVLSSVDINNGNLCLGNTSVGGGERGKGARPGKIFAVRPFTE